MKYALTNTFCGVNNILYSFTGPHKRILLLNGIEGNSLEAIQITLNYFTFYIFVKRYYGFFQVTSCIIDS